MSCTAYIVYAFHLSLHHANFGQFKAKQFLCKIFFFVKNILKFALFSMFFLRTWRNITLFWINRVWHENISHINSFYRKGTFSRGWYTITTIIMAIFLACFQLWETIKKTIWESCRNLIYFLMHPHKLMRVGRGVGGLVGEVKTI